MPKKKKTKKTKKTKILKNKSIVKSRALTEILSGSLPNISIYES